MDLEGLQKEWLYQQRAYDDYERSALHIKLFAFSALFILFYLKLSLLIGGIVLATIWLSEGIWKTFQSRIETRLLKVEAAISAKTNIDACQFNSEFLAQRGSAASLVAEYIKQSLKPTVAYPHILLIGIYVIGQLGF